MRLKQTLIALAAAGALGTVPAFAEQHGASGGQDPQMQSSAGAPQQQASSETVRAVQQALNDQGHDAGPVDGIMGPKTQSALEEFQQAQGIQGDGLDARTLTALGLEREAAEFAAGEVRSEDTEAQDSQDSGSGQMPSEPGMGSGGAPSDSGMGSGTPSPSGSY